MCRSVIIVYICSHSVWCFLSKVGVYYSLFPFYKDTVHREVPNDLAAAKNQADKNEFRVYKSTPNLCTWNM